MVFVLIDSFGMQMHPKLREAIDAAIKGNALARNKADRIIAGVNWPVLSA